jgi:hypothetical protein
MSPPSSELKLIQVRNNHEAGSKQSISSDFAVCAGFFLTTHLDVVPKL